MKDGGKRGMGYSHKNQDHDENAALDRLRIVVSVSEMEKRSYGNGVKDGCKTGMMMTMPKRIQSMAKTRPGID